MNANDTSGNAPLTRRQALKRQAPSWALSAALHAAILGPLCMITWVVAVVSRPDPVILLANVAAGRIITPAGDEEDGTEVMGGSTVAGAAGPGHDTQAVGAANDSISVPSLSPGDTIMETQVNSALAANLPPAGSPYGSQTDAMGSLIRNVLGPDSGAAGGGGLGGRGDLLRGTGEGFGKAVGEARSRGLDVVFCLDATGSMVPYIEDCKLRLRQVRDVVLALVPNARIGMVAYKDYCDEYGPTACISIKITKDSNAVLAFMDGIIPGGGGDEPEAVNEALKVATDMKVMGWGGNRKRVIILVGDSTIHPSGRNEAFELAKAFAEHGGVINVIDTGGGDQGNQPAGPRRQQIRQDLLRIAKEGRGVAFLLTDEKQFWQHLIVSVFGERFKDDVDVIIKKLAKKE